jgi:large subunit ribosomal protein L3
MHFGEVRGDYAILKGSVPGPASRFVMVRYKVRGEQRPQAAPQSIEVSTMARR